MRAESFGDGFESIRFEIYRETTSYAMVNFPLECRIGYSREMEHFHCDKVPIEIMTHIIRKRKKLSKIM